MNKTEVKEVRYEISICYKVAEKEMYLELNEFSSMRAYNITGDEFDLKLFVEQNLSEYFPDLNM